MHLKSRSWGAFLAGFLCGVGGEGGGARHVWALSLVHPSTLAISSFVAVWTLSLVHGSGILAGAVSGVAGLLIVTGHV